MAQPSPLVQPAMMMATSVKNSTNGREAEQRGGAGQQGPSEVGPARQEAVHVVDAAAALGGEDAPGDDEHAGLDQPVAEHVQQDGRGGQGPADGGAQGHDPHVLDAGVREQPLVVALRQHQGGCHRQRQQPGGDQQPAQEARTDHGVADRLDPQDRVQGHRQQDPGHQPRDRGGGLGVRVGQPAVHGRQAGLGREAEDGQGHGQARERRGPAGSIRWRAAPTTAWASRRRRWPRRAGRCPGRRWPRPTDPRTTYFQAASSARWPRWWPTRKAVAMVVASTATHRIPRLSASTARLIAARNRHTRAV